MKDKTEAKRIRDSFEKEMDDIATNKKTYEQEIEKLRKKPIPPALSSKLTDDRFRKTKAFEEMKHSHSKNSRLEMVDCLRCQFNEREIECENLIDGLTGNEKSVSDGNDLDLQSLKIVRGRFDDVMGFQWMWG